MTELRDLFGTSDPEEYRKKLALSLANSGLDVSPIRSGWQGAARLAQALVAGSMMNDLSGDKAKEQLDQTNAVRQASGLAPLNGMPNGNQSIFDMLGSKVFGGNSPQPQSQPTQAQPSGMPDYSSADTNAPRGFRNNNPGNIEASPWTQKQPGFSGVEPKGRFATFDTMENGVNAMGNLVGNYGQQGINTVQGIINRWAPAKDGNNTAAYAATVAKAAGIDPNAPVDMNDPAVRNRIVTAMAQYENGRSLPQGAALTQGGPVGVPGAQPQGMPQPMPQVAQAAPQAAPGLPQSQATRATPQIPPEIMARVDALSRNGTKAGLQQAQLLIDTYQKKALDQVRPLTDPAERARMGIQQTDTNPYQVDASGKVSAINPQPFAVNVNQQGQSEFEKHYGEGQSKRALATLESGDKAGSEIGKVNLTEAMFNQVKTGKLAPAQATIGAWAQAVGIDPKTLGIDPNLSIVSQAGQSLVAQQTVGMIGSGGFPANNFSDADRKFLQQIPGSIENLPEANKVLFEVKRRMLQRDIDKADAWATARADKQSYEDFERSWRKHVNGTDMFADLRGQFQPPQSGAPAVARRTAATISARISLHPPAD
jgi:hypothetical protein